MRDHLKLQWLTLLQTCLRMLPFPARTGLIPIGRPGPDSPVLLTCNFQLTVARVKQALKGLDVHLLVANSRGVNVWCAATGGLLTHHDVISVLKTSGIAQRVQHRHVILPQLAATGVEAAEVLHRSGWRVIWGPVEARDIPAFLAAGQQATQEMRRVRFPWTRRLEMAVAWAFPISLLAILATPWLHRGVAPLAGFVWLAALVVFLGFPLYQQRLQVEETPKRHRGFIFFDFGRLGLPLLLWGAFLLILSGAAAFEGTLSAPLLLRWGIASLVVLLILSLDLAGSTPTFKSGLHEDRLLSIELAAERCKGAGFCEQVCPTRVFEIDLGRHLALLPRSEDCVQCGACIVQCPFDALHFRTPNGAIIAPETLRRFKLNLLGHRARKVAGPG